MAELHLTRAQPARKQTHRGYSLFWRIAGAIIVVFVLLHAAGFWFYGHDRLVQNARTFATGVASRTVTLDTVLTEHPELLAALQSEQLTLRYDPTPRVPPRHREWSHNEEIAAAVRAHLAGQGYRPDEIGVWFTTERGRADLHLAMPAGRGGYVNVRAAVSHAVFRPSSPAAWSMSFLALLLVGGLLFVTRRITAPMTRFADAAEHLGTTLTADPLPEGRGSREVQRASAAFNEMQARLLKLLDERAEMLAGVSHDLRTLCARLSLRLEEMADGAQRDKAAREIEHMTNILDQALAFARDESSEEVFAPVDLASLLESLTDELKDDRHDAVFVAEAPVVLDAQPLAIARLFRNLMDNAIKYGGAVHVTLRSDGVVFRDPGEGFAADQIEDALKPYRRLQAYRPQDIPGTGLGLSIAHNVCQRHRWQLTFARGADGFEARVTFTV